MTKSREIINDKKRGGWLMERPRLFGKLGAKKVCVLRPSHIKKHSRS